MVAEKLRVWFLASFPGSDVLGQSLELALVRFHLNVVHRQEHERCDCCRPQATAKPLVFRRQDESGPWVSAESSMSRHLDGENWSNGGRVLKLRGDMRNAGLSPYRMIGPLDNTPYPRYPERCRDTGADFFFDKSKRGRERWHRVLAPGAASRGVRRRGERDAQVKGSAQYDR